MEQAVRPNVSKSNKKKQGKTSVVKPKKSDVDLSLNDCSEAEKPIITNNSTANDLPEVGDGGTSEDKSATSSMHDATENSFAVPGHFYKLCATKSDQSDVESYFISKPTFDVPSEATAPEEDFSLDSALSPTAPSLSGTPFNSNDFNLDPMMDELTNIEEEREGNVLLPLNDDDWELGVSEHQIEPLYPKLDDEEKSTPLLEPFTKEELSMFYHNVLLEHVDSYVDQFISDADDYNDKFKTLLSTYYEARQQLVRVKQKYRKYQKTVETATENVFITSVGQIEAEAQCQDRRKVSTVHHYDVCQYDAAAGSRLALVLREDRRIASEEVSLACYSSTVARLHCEQCLFEATEKYNHHRKRLQENSDNMASSVRSSILLQLIDESVRELKSVANVLFLFVRKKRCNDDQDDRFWRDLEKWIALIILHLLQSPDCATTPGRHFSEEMFILNHILRTPPGFYSWGNGLVQVSGPSFARDCAKDPTALDHCICLLYLVLSPVKDRQSFLAEYVTTDTSLNSEEKSDGWTMIDDDGDEMESLRTFEASVLPLEGDIIAVFRQMPLEGLLSSIIQLLRSPDSSSYSFNKVISSEDMMTTFATCDLVCDILGQGLSFYGRPRYKQLVRRVAQTLRNVVLIVSQHWQRYRLNIDSKSTTQRYNYERLQLEFDEFYKRCVSRLLAVAKLGVYQFVADLSYHHVSRRAAETLYLLMNVPPGVRSEVDTLISEGYSKQEWLDFIQDPDTKLAFEDHLSNLSGNEVVYLLTTFANLAQARPSTERHLVNTIATDIFKVSFVYQSTRDVCSKTGRELLSSVASYHPFIISTLLSIVQENISVAVYALSDLPFHVWQLSMDDVNILRTLILTNQVGSQECKLAQIVIQGLNFSLKSGSLFIPISIQHQIALLLVEACVLINEQQSGVVMKSFDHMTKVASAVRLTSHPIHLQFIGWCWKILFKLKLHQSQISSKPDPTFAPDINTDSTFLALLQAAKQHNPMACYVAIVAGTAGHRVEVFLQEGLEYFYYLAVSKNVRAMLHVFELAMPLFYTSNVNLGLNQRFVEILTHFLHATDEGILAGVASYLLSDGKAQDTSVSFLTSLIENYVNRKEIETERVVILSYWIQLVLSITSWYKDNHLRSLVDYIFKSSLLVGERCLLECRTILFDNYVSLVLHNQHEIATKQPKSVVTSFIQMVAGSNPESPSFIHVIASSKDIYFKYEVLVQETRYEDDCELWSTVLALLKSDSKLSIESAVKKSVTKLKLLHHPAHTQLALYRWAELSIHTPPDHPLLPLIWYNFFLRFIYLPKDGGNSFGCRFFDAVNMLPLYNKIRTRLQTSMEFHLGIISNKSSSVNDSRQHELLVKLYQCFKLWLEEPKMHESNLYLPSLPSQYNSRLLALVRTKNLTACDDVVDKPSIEHELQLLTETWNQLNVYKPKRRLQTRLSFHRQKSTDDSEERINHLLKQFDSPDPIPPDITAANWTPPVAIIDVASLCEYKTVIDEIDQDLKIMSSFADRFSRDEVKHHQINNKFQNLVSRLYFMKSTELTVTIECQSAFSATHKCSGAARVDLKFKQKTLDQSVAQQVQANRNLYKRELIEFMEEGVSEELGFASLHLCSVVRALEANMKNPTSSEEKQSNSSEAGIRLFYLLADMYSGERANCIPTKKLIANSVEMIGQKFVAQSSDEAFHILQQVINNPESAPLLSPHFAPGCKSKRPNEDDIRDYLEMYHKVVKLVSTTKNENPDLLFVLLTKFEVGTWLENFQPSFNQRTDLLHNIMIGMISCNLKPNSEDDSEKSTSPVPENVVTHKSSHSSVHEVYLNHYKSLLAHKYPELIIEALRYLLEASRTRDVAISTWQAFLDICFPDPILSVVDPSRNDYYSAVMQFNTVQNTIEFLTTYFNDFRNRTLDSKTTGLYVIWKTYVTVMSSLYSRLSNTYLCFVSNDQLPLLYTETHLTNDPQWTSISTLFELYGPWMRPCFIDADTSELGWPWRECDENIASHFIRSFSNLLAEFCHRDNLPTSSYLTHIWSTYAAAFLQDKRHIPSRMFSAYHSIMDILPWNMFVPPLSALDQMIQFSDGREVQPIQFLSFLIPKLSWFKIIDMCRVKPGDRTCDVWNPVAGEVLCRLLHILISLGSVTQRLDKYDELESLFETVEELPWKCIENEQLEFLSHLLSGRYSWTSPLIYQSVKSVPRDSRCCVFRLFKLVCGLPLTGEERGRTKSQIGVSPSEYSPFDWSKMHFFIKTVGHLLQKIRNDDKTSIKSATQPLFRFIERTFESIEMTSRWNGAEEHLPDLISVLFNFLNILPTSLQGTVSDSLRSVISRKAVCSTCASGGQRKSSCQDCVFSRSRSLSLLTLRSCVISACNSVTSASHLCVLLEDIACSYLDMNVCTSEKSAANETASKAWKNLLSAYNKPIVNNEELIKHSLDRGCIITLYIFALDSFEIVDFHTDLGFVSNLDLKDESLEKLYELAVLDIQWLSTVIPKSEIESKFFLVWDHFLCACAILCKVAFFSPTQGFTLHSMVDILGSLSSVLEQVSQDKVKTGLLGSLGIGTASPLSIEFRLTSKALIVYLRNWIAKADSSSPTSVSDALNSFEAFKNLPTSNKNYYPLRSSIEKACSYLEREEITLEGSRHFLALFVDYYFFSKTFLSHFTPLR